MNDLVLLMFACINDNSDILLRGDSSRNIQVQLIMEKRADFDLTTGRLRKKKKWIGVLD